MSGYNPFRWSAVTIVAAVMVGAFLLQSIEQTWLHNNLLINWGVLTMEGLRHGQVWRLVTYAFLHDGFWHLFSNILSLLFIGIPLQAEIGERATAIIMGLMAVAGGMLFTLVHVGDGGVLLGASAIGVGLLTLYCLNYPDRPITLLLFFVLPVTLLPKWILWFTLAVNAFGFFFSEIAPGTGAVVGYSAHLGGMLAAWVVQRWCLKNLARADWPAPQMTRKKVAAPEGVKKQIFFKGHSAKNYEVNLSSRSSLQKEVDRILDKINTKGFGALTADEKTTLDKAKDILGK